MQIAKNVIYLLFVYKIDFYIWFYIWFYVWFYIWFYVWFVCLTSVFVNESKIHANQQFKYNDIKDMNEITFELKNRIKIGQGKLNILWKNLYITVSINFFKNWK
jgi:hypothetical protein